MRQRPGEPRRCRRATEKQVCAAASSPLRLGPALATGQPRDIALKRSRSAGCRSVGPNNHQNR